MKTSLAELDRTVSDFISNENETPCIAVGQTQTRIAGFLVPDNSKRDALIVSRRQRVSAYQADHDALASALREQGVTPLAMLPTKTWDRICVESKLYRFVPPSDGMIQVDISILKYFHMLSKVLSIGFWTSIPLLLVYLAVFHVGWSHASLTNIGICAAIIINFVMYVTMADARPNQFIVVDGWLARQLTRLLNWCPHRALAQWFLPDRAAVTGFNTKTNWCTLVLPTPPAHVAEILTRVADGKFTLRVAAVADGFRFAESPSEILRDHVRDHTAQRIKAWAERDPIVYIQQGSATAIIAQFGDFPIEREVVEKVCKVTDYLI